MFKNLSLQEYFYVGYIYLILLGIVSDAIFYAILGIPYLNYVSILDALVSPFSLLTNNLKLTLILVIGFSFMYIYTTKWSFKIYKKFRDRKWYQKIYNIERWDKIYKDLEDKNNLRPGILFLFFLMFVSMRLGMGIGVQRRISASELKPNYQLVFKDNSEKKIRLIGQNSAFIFYIEDGERIIAVTPIADNVKQIKRLPKK